jgi:hypothetical protein
MVRSESEILRSRLSVLPALVLLGYGLARLPLLPTLGWEFPALGLLIRFDLPPRSLILFLAAVVAVAGADGVYRVSPEGRTRISRWSWVLPGLAAFAIGDVLARLPFAVGWWVGLAASAGVLTAIVYLEYRFLQGEYAEASWPASGLRGLGFLVMAVFLFDLRASAARAVFLFPLVLLAAGALGGRLLRLEPHSWSGFRYAGVVGILTAELAIGLYYVRVPPVPFALLTILGFSLVLAVIRQSSGEATPAKFVLETLGVTAAVLALALLAW